MRIQVKDEPIKAVMFYISEEEAADKELMKSLNPQFDSWKAKGYLPTVFESGKDSLEDGMHLLMKYNLELMAEKRVNASKREDLSR